MNSAHAPFVAADVNVSAANVKRASLRTSGGSHNEWGFSNRMLDTTISLMEAK